VNIFNKLRTKIDYSIENDEYARRWRWRPTIEWPERTLKIGLELQMTRWMGQEIASPLIVRGIWLNISHKISEWEISQGHTYYDGENCWYIFGPFTLLKRCWNHCAKYWADTE
jgi:hypothetical protein